jgi:fluoride exporter
MLLLAIFAGGAAGTLARYHLSGWMYARLDATFPWGTLSVNLTGSFALGLVAPLFDGQPRSSLAGLVVVGGIGAFTTFSTFAYEAVMLMRDGEPRRAAAYVAASTGLGLLSAAAGLTIALNLT